MAVINAVGNALTGSTGSGAFVGENTPTLITPVLGVASATSIAIGGGTAITTIVIGTWTPEFSCATPGTLSVSHTTQVGQYIRINNFVWVSCILNFTPTLGTASGSIRCLNLPFAASATQNIGTAITNSQFTFPAGTTSPVTRITSGATYAELQCVGSATATATFAISNIAGGAATVWNFNGFYTI